MTYIYIIYILYIYTTYYIIYCIQIIIVYMKLYINIHLGHRNDNGQSLGTLWDHKCRDAMNPASCWLNSHQILAMIKTWYKYMDHSLGILII